MANNKFTITELCMVFDMKQSTYYDQIQPREISTEKKCNGLITLETF